MYPGTTTGDQTVTVHVKNDGSGKQAVNSFTISVAKSDGTLWNCDATGTEPVCYEAVEIPTVQPTEKK